MFASRIECCHVFTDVKLKFDVQNQVLAGFDEVESAVLDRLGYCSV